MAYATLDEFKSWLNETTGEFDNDLLSALASAEIMVTRFVGRKLLTGSQSERVYGHDIASIFPARTPITAVASCIVNGQAVEVTFDDMAVHRKDGGCFGRRDEIILTYTGGFTAEQIEDVRTATMITAQAIWGSGDLDANMVNENIGNVAGGSYQPGGPGSIPRAAQTILSPLRRLY